MSDLISRSALLKSIAEISTSPLNEWDTAGVLSIIYKQPELDAVPVVHGEWVDNGIPDSMLSKCSVCGFACGAYSFNFCPNCGTDMRKKV